MRRRTAPCVLLLLLAPLGCSSSDDDSPTSAATSASPADPTPGATPTPAEPAYNPCDALRPRAVSRALGAEVTVEAGTPGAPRCALLPVLEGGATMNLTYAFLGLSLAETFATITPDEGAVVTTPSVAGADDARLIVNAQDEVLAVTGFVEDGELVQTVNALALAPYDEAAVVAATQVVMEQLSAGAPDEG